ncbi:MAG: glycosyltransferase family 4 protein [Candidatus Methanomethyliaceae archaeon]
MESPLLSVSASDFSDLRYFDVTPEDLTKHYDVLRRWRESRHREVHSINWFLPGFINIYGGGHYNIFRFANMFSASWGVHNRFAIYNPAPNTDPKQIESIIRRTFPGMQFEVLLKPEKSCYPEDWVPHADLAIATTWQSAYEVVRFNNTNGKYYFLQDFEPMFYPSGTLYALAENTYRWGIPAITFGEWLRALYVQNYNAEAQDFIPCVDTSIFKPLYEVPRRYVERIFFYARPISERRAFELGILVLEKLIQNHPALEIVMAGSVVVDLRRYRIPFAYKDYGSLPLEETAKLYQTCDIGLCFSMTNLSFLPLELMASGCIVVSNRGPTVEWLLRDNYNCLLAVPSPFSLARRIEEAIAQYELRERIFKNGLRTIQATSWDKEFERVRKYIQTGLYQNPVHLQQETRSAK